MAMSAPENAPRPGLPALKFGIIIPVGPSANDVERAGDVLASVLAYEPETPLVLFIDDGGKDRRLDEKFRATATCRLVNIFNTRNGHGIGETSGLSAGMLLAIAWLHANADCGFVMKLDTDALIIAPFAEKILRTLAARPDVGMVGLYNRMCDGSVRDQTSFRKMLGKLASPFAVWRNPPGWGYLTVHLWGRGATIRRQITEAIRAGYRPAEFILGGAYAFTGEAVRRFAKHGFLDDPHLWLGTHFSEDVVLSMYVCATGLRLHGMTADGEPFAVQHYGLPDTPERLVERGYSVIHSVKSDARFSEAAIREFYRKRREAQAAK
ncbi:hypothetical protein LBMAG57_04010 [Verrucomicrobiota bacterium]|jgi:hypothetical protein|nr:hypothetical protein LBMAG57_04010 [Verrucomicrobiota bacterium]